MYFQATAARVNAANPDADSPNARWANNTPPKLMASSTISALPSTKFGTKPNNPTTSHTRGEPADSGTKDRSKIAESKRNKTNKKTTTTNQQTESTSTKRV